MYNFKGTKGKWYRNTDSRIVSSVYSINKESLIHISGKCTEEKQANAQLISCAPEMLYFINRISAEMLRNDFVLDEKWYEQAQQIIKKATTI